MYTPPMCREGVSLLAAPTTHTPCFRCSAAAAGAQSYASLCCCGAHNNRLQVAGVGQGADLLHNRLHGGGF